MTNKEKSEELRKTALPNPLPDGYGMWLSAGDVDAVLIKMAKWKEQQMIEKACQWLELYANEYAFADYTGDELNGEAYISNKLIQDFKKAMEEQL